MKTVVLFLVATLMAGGAMASGNLKVNFASNDADVTVVEITNAKLSDYEIEISDEYGYELYSMETIAPIGTLSKKYDFSGLDNGIYWYKVKTDKETKTSRIQVDNGTVEVLDIRKSVEPVFKMEDNKLKFSFLNFPEEDVKLYVYDANNKVLAEEKLGNGFAINKAIDLSELVYGDYEVVIANDADIFSYQVSVK